jgi:hypothetical protein
MKGRIYKIIGGAGDTEMVYIGSTTKSAEQRFQLLVQRYNAFKNTGNGFISSFAVFDKHGPENCRIEIIEDKQYNTLTDMRCAERAVIKATPHAVNKRMDVMTAEERKAKRREYDINNNYSKQKRYFSSEKGKAKLREAGKKYYAKKQQAEKAQVDTENPLKD